MDFNQHRSVVLSSIKWKEDKRKDLPYDDPRWESLPVKQGNAVWTFAIYGEDRYKLFSYFGTNGKLTHEFRLKKDLPDVDVAKKEAEKLLKIVADNPTNWNSKLLSFYEYRPLSVAIPVRSSVENVQMDPKTKAEVISTLLKMKRGDLVQHLKPVTSARVEEFIGFSNEAHSYLAKSRGEIMKMSYFLKTEAQKYGVRAEKDLAKYKSTLDGLLKQIDGIMTTTQDIGGKSRRMMGFPG